MSDVKLGDRVRIKDRLDWPLPTGYKLANAEGQVVEVIEGLEGYVRVLLDESQNQSGMDPSLSLSFRVDAIEKI